ncbi:hypothetical protein Q3C01_43620 [Bradyrhizobium sp. UFLA05-109]
MYFTIVHGSISDLAEIAMATSTRSCALFQQARRPTAWVHEELIADLEATLERVRPRGTRSDIANALCCVIENIGIEKLKRCWYPICIDRIWKTASLADDGLTDLKPNTIFRLMLGNWISYVISESFSVTESRVEVLTRTPRKCLEV